MIITEIEIVNIFHPRIFGYYQPRRLYEQFDFTNIMFIFEACELLTCVCTSILSNWIHCKIIISSFLLKSDLI